MPARRAGVDTTWSSRSRGAFGIVTSTASGLGLREHPVDLVERRRGRARPGAAGRRARVVVDEADDAARPGVSLSSRSRLRPARPAPTIERPAGARCGRRSDEERAEERRAPRSARRRRAQMQKRASMHEDGAREVRSSSASPRGSRPPPPPRAGRRRDDRERVPGARVPPDAAVEAEDDEREVARATIIAGSETLKTWRFHGVPLSSTRRTNAAVNAAVISAKSTSTSTSRRRCTSSDASRNDRARDATGAALDVARGSSRTGRAGREGDQHADERQRACRGAPCSRGSSRRARRRSARAARPRASRRGRSRRAGARCGRGRPGRSASPRAGGRS